MIVLNGAVFASGKNEAVNTLFDGNATAAGWYKLTASGIILYSMAGERDGGISRNRVLYASTLVDGRLWHSYADVKGIPAWPGYRAKCEAVDVALELWRAEREVAA